MNKRKPIVLCPDQLYLGLIPDSKSGKQFFMLHIPLTFVNKGSRMVLINRLNIQLRNADDVYNFRWFMKNEKIMTPISDIQAMADNLVAPFQVAKYSAISIMVSFATNTHVKILPSNYQLELKVFYNVRKSKNFIWGLRIQAEDLIHPSKLINIINFMENVKIWEIEH